VEGPLHWSRSDIWATGFSVPLISENWRWIPATEACLEMMVVLLLLVRLLSQLLWLSAYFTCSLGWQSLQVFLFAHYGTSVVRV
jgi:hypothetical protein